ncbi:MULTISPECIES: hemagglutinin repeat-containing protein [unclassified Haematospirillum]|uniref:two-partner secretion domain-containing protein n=1 Tax=unclassified Haematospirillum TaxID=2622088 RepID=UPI00143AF304|nr:MULTISPECIES: hemagglutinin repeat-containing protein [unclassified Haematospirillum]NKD56002.1 filamentous hemagglutinin N-terminal domain-containing protein [Haematospirillum sp. H4890]NKD76019.1 filamentous hemagglutinin N-terminal domain-containing protein [Haematospirillum sp. H4485]
MHTLIRAFRLFQKASALLAALFYPLSPVLVHAQPVTNTERAFDDQSRSGIPLFNINTPNSSGVSNNLHHTFDVPLRGAIDNNSAIAAYSKLEAGFVEGNPNLTPGHEAELIIHQVIGGTRSQMDGLLEVVGPKARVVVINEDGITCNSCGFINTSRATLSTGAAIFNDRGELERFEVRGGDILFDGTGFDATKEDQSIGQIDLVARTIALRDEAKVKGLRLNVVMGTNRVDANSLAADPITVDTPAPDIALDVAALGGMYANQIALVATEDGAGVNMNGAMVSASSLTLDAKGYIRLGSGSSLSAGTDTTITTTDRFENAGTIKSSGSISVAAHTVDNTGTIDAGTSVSIGAVDTIKNSGTIKSGQKTTLAAGRRVENRGTVLSDGDSVIDAPFVLNDGGKIIGKNTLDIGYAKGEGGRSESVENRNGTIEAGKTLSNIKAKSIVNQGTAPTVRIKDNVETFRKEPGPVNPGEDIRNRLVSADILAPDGSVDPGKRDDYLLLLETFFSGTVSGDTPLDPRIVRLLRTSALDKDNPDRSSAAWVAYFQNLGGKAVKAGVPSLVDFMRDLLVEEAHVTPVVAADDSTAEDSGVDEPVVEQTDPFPVKDAYRTRYIALWEKLASGQALDDTTLSAIDPKYIKDGAILPEVSALWKAIRAGSGAGYDILVTITQDALNNDGVLATIRSGGGLSLDADSIRNVYGEIRAGEDLKISARTVTNIAFGASRTRHEVHKRACYSCHQGTLDFVETFGGVIEAGGILDIEAEQVNNLTIGSRSAAEMRAEINSQTGKKGHVDELHDRQAATTPRPRRASPGQEYRVPSTPGAETSTLLTLRAELEEILRIAKSDLPVEKPGDLKAFLSSAYLLDRLNYGPMAAQHEPGLSEILSLDRTVWPGGSVVGSAIPEEHPIQVGADRFLSENLVQALASPPALENGDVPLSAAMAFLNRRNGGLVAGGTTTITAGDIKQRGGGQIKSTGNTTLAARTIDLERGELAAGGAMSVSGHDTVRLAGTKVKADGNLAVKSQAGHVSIEGLKEETRFTRASYAERRVRNPDCAAGRSDCTPYRTVRTKVGEGSGTAVTHRGSTVDVGGTLTVEAGGTVSVLGSKVEAAGNTTLKAGRDLVVGATRDEHTYAGTVGRSTHSSHSQRSRGSSISTGGTLTAEADGSVSVMGSKVEAADNATLKAGRGLVVGATRDVSSDAASSRRSTRSAYAERLQGSSVLSGGDVRLSGTDIGIDASRVSADGRLDVVAGNALSVAAGAQASRYASSSTSKGRGLFRKKKTEHVNESRLTYESSVLSGGRAVSLDADGDMEIAGSRIKSGGNVDITALGGLHVTSLHEQYVHEYRVKKSGAFGGFLGGSGFRTEQHAFTGIKGSDVTSVADLTTESGSDTTIRASRVSAGGTLTLRVGKGPFAAPDARLHLLSDTERDYLSVSEHRDGGLKWTMTERGHEREVVRHALLESGGDFVIESPGGIVVEYRATGDLATDIDQLAQAPGLGYLATVRTLPGVDWKGVEETYRSWHDQKSGISGGAMVLIALATAVLTAGATASLAANIVGVAEVAAGTSVSAGMATMSMAGATYAGTAAQLTAMTMTNAALAGVAGTVSTSVANGAVSGDMQGALRSIVSSNTLRSLVVSALTAGLTQGVSDGLGLDGGITRAGAEAGSTASTGATTATTTAGAGVASAAGHLAGLGQTVVQDAINTGVLAVVDMAVNGEGLDTAARSALVNGAVGVVSAQVFRGIGDLGVEFGIGEGDVRKVLVHAAAGCGIGAATSGSCLAGAVGAGLQELASPVLDGLSDNAWMRVQLAGLAGAAATMLTGASAKEVEAAARIASLARANNRELHPDQARVLAELGEGASEDEKERLEDAALYLRHATAGVQDDDPVYATLQARVDRGRGYVKEQSRLLATGLYAYTRGDRALDLLTANNSVVGQAIGAGKMAVGGAEVLGGVAAAAAGTPTVVGAGVGSLVVYDGVDTARNSFQETRANYRAPLGQGVLQSLNPDNPVSVQDQVLQQRLEQAGLTSENMIVAGAVAVGGAAVRGAEKAFAPVARAIGRTADDILASAPVQAMGNSARKLAGDIGEKAGHALDRVAEKVGLGGLKPATAGGALTRTTPDTPAANAFLREGTNTPATPDVAAKGVVDEAGKTGFDRKAITKGFQDHHIISNKNRATKDHDLLDLADFDLDSRANRIFLPTKAELHPTRSIHLGRHRDEISKGLGREMDDIAERGRLEGWTTPQYRDELDKIIARERKELRSGETGLNKNKRPWAED